MYRVASRRSRAAGGGGELAEVQLPVGTWHAYRREGGTATLCGIPLEQLHIFEALTFLPVRSDDLCVTCLHAAEAETSPNPSKEQDH